MWHTSMSHLGQCDNRVGLNGIPQSHRNNMTRHEVWQHMDDVTILYLPIPWHAIH